MTRSSPPTAALTRRAFVASSGLAALAGCHRRKGTGYPGFALIAAAGEQAIAVVDLTRFRHVQDIALKAEPKALLAGPDGQIYALTPANGSLHQLDAELQLKTSLRWSDTLAAAMLSADSRSLAALSPHTHELCIGSLQTIQVQKRYKLKAEPQFMAAGAPNYLAVSSAAGSIELFDLHSGQRWHRALPGSIGRLVFRADGQILLAANLRDRSLVALSVPSLDVVAELPLAMRPDHLCFSADGGQLFVSGEGMDGIAIVFPYRILQVDETVLAGRDPGLMAVSEAPAYLFVASASGSDICVMDIDHRRVIGLVDVAQQPGFIILTPDNQYALVLNEASGDMAVIHVSAIRQDFLSTAYRSGAALFTMLPVGDRPVHAIVVPAAA